MALLLVKRSGFDGIKCFENCPQTKGTLTLQELGCGPVVFMLC